MKPGQRVGRYTLVQSRGSGGMGTVWEADADGRVVALKLMHAHLADDESLVKRFEREFEVGQRVRHRNLVSMLDYGQHQDVPYIVMELAAGKSLRKLIDKGAPFFHEWEAAEVGAQVADALGALHAAGIVHRDLKSSNIMVDRELHAKVIDYGIARDLGENTISSGNVFMGTAEYSAPEPYFARDIGPPSDIYSLGIVLHEMLTGRVPFRSDRYTDTLRMHAELPAPRITASVPMVSDQTDSLVYQMLQKHPDQRPTPTQVAMACRSVLRLLGREPVGGPQSVPPRPAPVAPAPPPPPPASLPPPAAAPARTSTGPVGLFVGLGLAAALAVGGILAIVAAQ